MLNKDASKDNLGKTKITITWILAKYKEKLDDWSLWWKIMLWEITGTTPANIWPNVIEAQLLQNVVERIYRQEIKQGIC